MIILMVIGLVVVTAIGGAWFALSQFDDHGGWGR